MGELERGVLFDVHGEPFNIWNHTDLIEGLLLCGPTKSAFETT